MEGAWFPKEKDGSVGVYDAQFKPRPLPLRHITQKSKLQLVMKNSDMVKGLSCHFHLTNSDTGCKYLLRETEEGDGKSELCEVLKFTDDPRSWFIGNSVHAGETSFVTLHQNLILSLVQMVV